MGVASERVWAHVDESYPRLPNGRFLYTLAHVVTDESQRAAVRDILRQLAVRERLAQLHFAEENRARRVALAKHIADLELTGSIVVTQTSARSKLEQCRSRLLVAAAASLQQVERVEQLVIESRNQADKNDRKTVDVAQARRQLTGQLHVDFARKSEDPLLWVADVIASAFTAAEKGGDPEPWRLLNETQIIDVRRL